MEEHIISGEGKKAPKIEMPNAEMKRKLYETAIKEIKERVKDIGGAVERMATVAAVLKDHIPYYFWCGFYFAEKKEMIIGPYQGSPACPNISYDGVCGQSAQKGETLIISDVHIFPGHIACDIKSNSEIVVPLFDRKKRLIAVLDVDSTEKSAFDDIDKEILENEIMPILLEKEYSGP